MHYVEMFQLLFFFSPNISSEQFQHHKAVFGTGMLCLIEIDSQVFIPRNCWNNTDSQQRDNSITAAEDLKLQNS